MRMPAAVRAEMLKWCYANHKRNPGDAFSAMRATWIIMEPEERAAWSMDRIYRESEKLGIC